MGLKWDLLLESSSSFLSTFLHLPFLFFITPFFYTSLSFRELSHSIFAFVCRFFQNCPVSRAGNKTPPGASACTSTTFKPFHRAQLLDPCLQIWLWLLSEWDVNEKSTFSLEKKKELLQINRWCHKYRTVHFNSHFVYRHWECVHRVGANETHWVKIQLSWLQVASLMKAWREKIHHTRVGKKKHSGGVKTNKGR